jgi:signal transduction histidine kinase
MSVRRVGAAVVGAVVVAHVGSSVIADAVTLRTWTNAWWTASALASLIACLVARAHANAARLRLAWTCYAVGAAGWLLGQVWWDTQAVMLGSNPFPSVADIGYLVLPVAFAAGTFVHVGKRSPLFGVAQLGDLGLVAGTSILATAWMLWPEVQRDGALTLYEATAFGWAVLSTTAFTFALVMRWQHARRRDASVLSLLVAALALHAIAGTIYGAKMLGHDYEAGTPLDATWVLIHGLIVLAAAVERGREAETEREVSRDHGDLLDAIVPAAALVCLAAAATASEVGVAPPVRTLTFVVGLVIVASFGMRSWARLKLTRSLAERESALRTQLQHSERVAAIGALAGGAAHDFNNLLQAMIGAVEAARDPDPAQRAAAIDELEELVMRASGLTSRLVSLARKTDRRPMAVDPGEAVEQLAALVRRVVPKTIAVDVTVHRPLPTIRVDVAGLEMALLNLAVNARDAMIEEGGRLGLTVRRARHDALADAVVFEVSDTGCGMPEEVRKRIFEPFFTTKAAGKGTGLGLPMVEAFAVEHGGAVAVDSAPGNGATFRIALPARDEASVSTLGPIHAGVEVLVVVPADAPGLALVGAIERAGFRTRQVPDVASLPSTIDGAIRVAVVDETRVGRDALRLLRERAPSLPTLVLGPSPPSEEQLATELRALSRRTR